MAFARANRAQTTPVAVVDIGSNSTRLVVLRPDEVGGLEIVADSHLALRLVRDVDASGTVSPKRIAELGAALRGFRAISRGAGAPRMVVVATAAVRDIRDRKLLEATVRESAGVELRVLSAQEEAMYALRGSVLGSPVESGMMVDIGGGSLQVAYFEDRHYLRSTSLPLGALRLSDRFLSADPPREREVESLQQYVAEMIASESLPPLPPGQQVIGTGGTIRGLARIDRKLRPYPLSRLHGYRLTRARVDEELAQLRSLSAPDRAAIRGLSDDRADSIVGGAACLSMLMQSLDMTELIVSGGGLREGLAAEAAGLRMFNAEQSRSRSVNGLGRRFSSWDPIQAGTRSDVAALLMNAIEPPLPADVAEVVLHAAALLDVGRSIDYYDRIEHSELIVLGAQLSGFTHRMVALMAAIMRRTEGEKKSLKAYLPLFEGGDETEVARASALLALADGVAGQFPQSQNDLNLRCERKSANVALMAPWLDAWPLEAAGKRFERAFGVALSMGTGGGSSSEAA